MRPAVFELAPCGRMIVKHGRDLFPNECADFYEGVHAHLRGDYDTKNLFFEYNAFKRGYHKAVAFCGNLYTLAI